MYVKRQCFGIEIRMKKITECSFPEPFESRLEFNPPVHGTWNIVHTGMLVPEAQQIYICADNCMRGVVLTAAEMGAIDRFNCVVLEEDDLMESNLEAITIDGVTDILNKIRQDNLAEIDHGSPGAANKRLLPPAVLCFPVCLHHFTGCDLNYVYDVLKSRFPEVTFVRCWMDPVMQKNGPSPMQKTWKGILDEIPAYTENDNKHAVSIVGNDFRIKDSSEIVRLIKECGFEALQIQDCETFEDFLQLKDAFLTINCAYPGEYGSRITAKKQNRKYLSLPISFSDRKIREDLSRLIGLMSEKKGAELSEAGEESLLNSIIEDAKRDADSKLRQARRLIGETKIALDSTAFYRPLGLARLLTEYGFHVKIVYADGFLPDEEEDFKWLCEHRPEISVSPVIDVRMRTKPRGAKEKILAIGPKAAWFENTEYFVNLVEDGGLWGFSGIAELAEMMIDAFENPKDLRTTVPMKGLGCDCIVMR